MANLDVEHFLDIYKTRMEMQEEGITNPPQRIKDFTKKLVEKLSLMPLDEEIILEKNTFLNSKRELILKLPDNSDYDFFKTIMPETRNADFYLGCLDGSVFMDFKLDENNLTYLVRISFDGFGCCDIEKFSKPLTKEKSMKFIQLISEAELNQIEIATIVKEAIKENSDYIWEDALKHYDLIMK